MDFGYDPGLPRKWPLKRCVHVYVTVSEDCVDKQLSQGLHVQDRLPYILSSAVLESLLLALSGRILYSHSNNSSNGSFYRASIGLSIKVYLR